MKNFFAYFMVGLLIFICGFSVNTIESSAEEKQELEVSNEDMTDMLFAISENEFSDGDSVIVNDKYLITCDIDVTTVEPKERNVYSVTKSATQTFTATVLGTKKQVFKVTQTAVAVFNTYTDKVSINSHTATFTAIDPTYRLISITQATPLNVWNEMISSRKEMVIGQYDSQGMLAASVTVYNSSGEFVFRFNQAW